MHRHDLISLFGSVFNMAGTEILFLYGVSRAVYMHMHEEWRLPA